MRPRPDAAVRKAIDEFDHGADGDVDQEPCRTREPI